MTTKPEEPRADRPTLPEGVSLLQFLQPNWSVPDEDRADILSLFRILKKRWRVVAAVSVLGTLAGVMYALLATPIYRAETTIAAPRETKPSAATAALTAIGGLGADIIGNLGISLAGTDATRLEALLRSHRLIDRVITDHNLLPLLFDDDWDHEKETWRTIRPEDIPDVWDFMEEIDSFYRVKNDTKSGIIRISFDHKNPVEARKILVYILEDLANLIQQDEINRIDANVRFAESQLKTATDPVIISKLQSLLSDQIEKAMMAQNTESFAYDLIDPPSASDKKVRPKRRTVVLLSLSGSLLLGTFAALLSEVSHKSAPQRAHPS